jgi:hypothetical protein
MDSNACRAREVERKVWRDNDSLLRSLLLKTPQLVIGRFRCVNPAKARGSGAVSLALEQLSSEVADDAPPIAYCRASLKARRLGVTAGQPGYGMASGVVYYDADGVEHFSLPKSQEIEHRRRMPPRAGQIGAVLGLQKGDQCHHPVLQSHGNSPQSICVEGDG